MSVYIYVLEDKVRKMTKERKEQLIKEYGRKGQDK